jgi:hypothetical protein
MLERAWCNTLAIFCYFVGGEFESCVVCTTCFFVFWGDESSLMSKLERLL